MKITLTEIAQTLDIPGDYPNDFLVTNIEFDSRLVTPGTLFVPLSGTRDGHEFIEQAKENGAIATLWSQEGQPEGLAVFPVEDVKDAFQRLAVYYLQLVNPKVVAITGSNGKTTTKDMTESVLAQRFRTHKTQGNYNNELGVPYTILHMPDNCEMLVLEMGMDHRGEIAFLSKLAQPEAAAITLIGEAHMENLGSRAGIAQAKMEITEGLEAQGTLIVPADEPLLAPLLEDCSQEIVTFGFHSGEVQARIVEETKESTTFLIHDTEFKIPVLGSYNVKNALIAYAFGRHFGLSEKEIYQGLADFQLTKNRTQWVKAANGADLLSDVYNANPTAMGLVLDSFAKLDLPGRRFAVLADMLELGEDSKAMHQSMADHLTTDYSKIFLYGEEMEQLAKILLDAPFQVYYFPTNEKEKMIQTLRETIQPTDQVLLKGSNGMGLAEVVAALQVNENEDENV